MIRIIGRNKCNETKKALRFFKERGIKVQFQNLDERELTAGSLCPSFLPARLVGLAVKRPCAIALYARLPSVLRAPWEASVTLLEATTPVKLPTKQCPPRRVSSRTRKGPYFNDG